jgi:hypothetical protein
LCLNENAIELLKENQDKINWDYLSFNPNAIKLLKENQDIPSEVKNCTLRSNLNLQYLKIFFLFYF